MSVKEHYDNHLGNFYSWMMGNLEKESNKAEDFFKKNNVFPKHSKLAIDLGAGHGIHTTALGRIGFQVKALDFNGQLLKELKNNTRDLLVEIAEEDIRLVKKYKKEEPELIICMGDTIVHLDNRKEIIQFIGDCTETLFPNGKLILSLRDYSSELIGSNRFIPVKSDENRILTCFLEYERDAVSVTDLLYEKSGTGWNLKISSYKKVRISPLEISNITESFGLKVLLEEKTNGLTTFIFQK